MNTLQQKIESLLFYKNEPTSFSWLGKQLGTDAKEIEDELYDMLEYYEDRGIKLVILKDKALLLTSEVSQDIIAKLSSDQSEQELSKQALETLAIILYNNGISKAELDYIRGVNSVYILRNLLIRGLIEKRQNPKDKRSSRYFATGETLSYLGIKTIQELSEFQYFKDRLKSLEKSFLEESQENDIHAA